MPGRKLPAYPAFPSHAYVVTLGATRYRVRLTWRWRLSAWYLDVSKADGTPIVRARRLSPGYLVVPDLAATGAVGDLLFVDGVDGYGRSNLGDGLEVIYLTRAELPAQPVAEDAPVVELGP